MNTEELLEFYKKLNENEYEEKANERFYAFQDACDAIVVKRVETINTALREGDYDMLKEAATILADNMTEIVSTKEAFEIALECYKEDLEKNDEESVEMQVELLDQYMADIKALNDR